MNINNEDIRDSRRRAGDDKWDEYSWKIYGEREEEEWRHEIEEIYGIYQPSVGKRKARMNVWIMKDEISGMAKASTELWAPNGRRNSSGDSATDGKTDAYGWHMASTKKEGD